MSADALLAHRLIDKGKAALPQRFVLTDSAIIKPLGKILHIIDNDYCRHLGLVALSSVTRHNGLSTKSKIAGTCTAKLVSVLRTYHDDPVIAELSVATLFHSLIALCGEQEEKRLLSHDPESVLLEVVCAPKQPSADSQLIDHALYLAAAASTHCLATFGSNKSLSNFLVVSLKSPDWMVRAAALGGLIGAYTSKDEPGCANSTPFSMVMGMQDLPAHLEGLLDAYGWERCDSDLALATITEGYNTMMDVGNDKDFHELCIKLAEFILHVDFSIQERYFQSDELPFTMRTEVLPHCARILRSRSTNVETDILEIKYSIFKQCIHVAVAIAQCGLSRNLQVAYYHYVISLAANSVDGLRP
ncbi:hypothetical protein FISHEDRAFT_76940 [Fistulina hepatica ATCC 64428]|uniref:ARM repeat-containing protein n=1 Tax=Fistulina hepatica ATCC 64428 TaxID=1128425 RepID=A0A0D7A5B2_9AGAR|nr:hypothetical protein FISHEDRAFT_76940 [Fistulina hepatica ATCC 64428]